MDELPAEFREILALRHQEGLSYEEIADVAQIPPGTVMSRLARARTKLKECLVAHIGRSALLSPPAFDVPVRLSAFWNSISVTRREYASQQNGMNN